MYGLLEKLMAKGEAWLETNFTSLIWLSYNQGLTGVELICSSTERGYARTMKSQITHLRCEDRCAFGVPLTSVWAFVPLVPIPGYNGLTL